MIINGIEFNGISKQFPNNAKYFNQEFFSESLKIDTGKPEIKEIISVNVDISLNLLKAIDTPIRTSNEGRKLLGKKLLIELTINNKIKYLSKDNKNFIYMLSNRMVKSSHLILPKELNGVNMSEIHRKGGITVNSYIEDIYATIKNSRDISMNICFIVDANIKNILY